MARIPISPATAAAIKRTQLNARDQVWEREGEPGGDGGGGSTAGQPYGGLLLTLTKLS